MASSENALPEGEKLRRAVCWMSEILQTHPEKKRQDVLREAEVRFDLSPRECEFLDQNCQ